MVVVVAVHWGGQRGEKGEERSGVERGEGEMGVKRTSGTGI